MKDCSAPIVWRFTPEHLQDPDKVADYLKENCYGSFREAQSYAVCWVLATVYWAPLITGEHLQVKRRKAEQQTL